MPRSTHYIPMEQCFIYLVAIQDWYSRKVLSWSLSNTLSSWFWVEVLKDALPSIQIKGSIYVSCVYRSFANP